MRYLIYNCHSKVMSNSPKMGHLPIPDLQTGNPKKLERPTTWRIIPQLIVDTASPVAQWDGPRQNPQVGRAAVVSAKEPCLWRWTLMWLKQCHKPLTWEWFIPTIYGDLGDSLLLF